MSKKEDFDYAAFEAEALKQLQSGGKLEGRDGVLAPLLKRLLEASLSGELDSHLSEEKSKGNSNRRNGRTRKTVKTSFGPIEVEQSRDRSGSFEPELIGKRERVLGTALETKILSLYANGSSVEKYSWTSIYPISRSCTVWRSLSDQAILSRPLPGWMNLSSIFLSLAQSSSF